MKLLLISRCPPYPLHLGDRLIPYHLARQLAERGHQIDLLAFSNRPKDLNEIDHYRAYFRSVQLIPEPSRSQISYLARLTGILPFFPTQAQQSWSPEMWQAIESKLAAERYDVVQLFGGIQVYEYRELLRVPKQSLIRERAIAEGIRISKLLPPSALRLFQVFSQLPGIDPRRAARLTFELLRAPKESSDALMQAITELKSKTHLCSICYNVTETDPCPVCQDPARDHGLVAVVEYPLDVFVLEQSSSFNGCYHVLHGVINPAEGIAKEHLKIKELVQRVQQGQIKEVILFTDPYFEGDLTADAVYQELKQIRDEHPVKVKLALPGQSAQSYLEYWGSGTGSGKPGRYAKYRKTEVAPKTAHIIVPYESYSLYLERHMQQASGIGKLLSWLQLVAARRFERRMFSGYGAVVVLTDKDRDTLNGLNPDYPLHVIPNGIDTNYFVPGSQSPDPNLLAFVGNFEYAPNLAAALWLLREILPRVQQIRPETRLVLAGNLPPEHADILQRALREGVTVGVGHDRPLRENSVEITGRVPDVRPYVQPAAVFICPLRIGAGIKNKVLEAMAMGKALVATPLSCDGIDVKAGEQVLFGDSAEALAQATIELLNDPARCEQMGKANRQFIEQHFTWSYVADQYETLYRELIKG